jgi:hypothetical protein
MCRVYGKQRLPLLVDGYSMVKELYWVKDEQNRWVQSRKKEALDFEALAGSDDPLRNVYALGCFVLRRRPGERR